MSKCKECLDTGFTFVTCFVTDDEIWAKCYNPECPYIFDGQTVSKYTRARPITNSQSKIYKVKHWLNKNYPANDACRLIASDYNGRYNLSLIHI